jgi:hypothetical protein
LWLIYALGGGWGHLTRAASLALAASHRRIRIVTNSPYAAQVRAAMPSVDIAAIDPLLPLEEGRRAVWAHLESTQPECLIVDTFPRGLGGELAAYLPACRAVKILVHRDLTPAYVEAKDLRDFVRRHYALVIAAGEGPQLGEPLIELLTAPWLARSARDLPERSPVPFSGGVLICAGGYREELEWFGAVASGLAGRLPFLCVAAECPPGCPTESWIRYWPAMDLFPHATVVIGGAGYNTVYECEALRVPLVARPWSRKYDRQWLRLKHAAARGAASAVESPDEAVRAAVRVARPPLSARRAYVNGADRAAARIEALVRSSPAPVDQSRTDSA